MVKFLVRIRLVAKFLARPKTSSPNLEISFSLGKSTRSVSCEYLGSFHLPITVFKGGCIKVLFYELLRKLLL